MVASFTGLNRFSYCTTQRGVLHSGSDFVTSFFLITPKMSLSSDVNRDARSRALTSIRQQAMAYKEAKPQTFVRIIVPSTARVM